MRRRDRTPLPQDVARELAALDAAIAGEAVDPDLAELAALAVDVRDARPRPDAGVIARLDERAAAGFARTASPRPRSRRRALLPAAACALAVVTIAGVAVIGGGGSDRPGVVATAPAPRDARRATWERSSGRRRALTLRRRQTRARPRKPPRRSPRPSRRARPAGLPRAVSSAAPS